MEMQTKRCSTCGVRRPVSDFNVRRAAPDQLQSRCRPCSQQWYRDNSVTHRANVRRNTQTLLQRNRTLQTDYLLEHPCVDCGERDLRCLDFDHREGCGKVADIGKLMSSAYAWSRILEEIEKCDVRCANCHRRRTAERAGWWRHQVQQRAEAARAGASLARLELVLQRPST